jgi:hypothetical protein
MAAGEHGSCRPYEYLGYTSQEMNEFAFTALSRRLKVIGIWLPAIAA